MTEYLYIKNNYLIHNFPEKYAIDQTPLDLQIQNLRKMFKNKSYIDK